MVFHRFQNTSPSSTAAKPKRKAIRNMRSTSSRASFKIKKVEPQIRVAHTIMGLASFFIMVSFITSSTPG